MFFNKTKNIKNNSYNYRIYDKKLIKGVINAKTLISTKFYFQGSIRYALNSAFACIMVSDLTEDAHAARRYHKWAQSQVDYVLGAKNNGFSFMVGFGKKYPIR